MKRNLVALAALIFAVFGPACPLYAAEVKTKQNKPAKESFDTQPFNSDVISLPRNYKGHDPQMIARTLATIPKKGEYETRMEYESRLSAWDQKPLFGNVKINDNIAIISLLFGFKRSYDADTEELTITLDHIVDGMPCLIIDNMVKELPSVMGITAMGVKFKYERKIYTEFCVELAHFIDAKISIPRAIAQGAFLTVALVLLCHKI